MDTLTFQVDYQAFKHTCLTPLGPQGPQHLHLLFSDTAHPTGNSGMTKAESLPARVRRSDEWDCPCTRGPPGGHTPRSSGDPGLTCSEVTAVTGLASPQAFPRAAASTGAARVWGRGAKALAAGRVAPLWHRQSRGQGSARTLGPGSRSPSPPASSPCRRGCQSSGSGLGSSPSELLMLELELEQGLGPRPARQAKRKGPPGKIPFREFSRQWSGEGLVAGPG